MRAAFDHAAVVKHQHLVYLLEARETMRDQERRALACDREQVREDRVGGLRVEVLAGLVEHEHGEVREQRPRDRQALALPT